MESEDGEIDVSLIKTQALRRRAENKATGRIAKFTFLLFIIVVVLLVLFA